MSMIAGPNTATSITSKKTNFNFNGGKSSGDISLQLFIYLNLGCEMLEKGSLYKNPIGISAQRASCGV